MKKRPYRAIPVNEISDEDLAGLVGRRIVVGIDVAKRKMVAAFMDENRDVLLTVQWNQIAAPRALRSLLEGLASAHAVEVVLEPSGTYGHALMHDLHADWPVYLVNGKRVHDAKEVYDGVPSSHDGKCASLIARLHLEGGSKAWNPESEERRDLRAATKRMRRYHRRIQDLTNELEAELGRFWPELADVLELGGATMIALLASYPGPALVRRDATGTATLMRETGRNFLSQEKIDAVIASSRTSQGVKMTPIEEQALQELCIDLQRARKDASRAESEAKRLSSNSSTARNIAPIVGDTTSAVLAASLGEVGDYDCAAAYVKAFGLNLKERSSGREDGRPLRITKRGPSEARSYLYFAVLRLLQSDPIVRAWYGKKVQRDAGKKMKAIVAVMRKLARALWHVGRGDTFDATKLFDTSKLNLPQTFAQAEREASMS